MLREGATPIETPAASGEGQAESVPSRARATHAGEGGASLESRNFGQLINADEAGLDAHADPKTDVIPHERIQPFDRVQPFGRVQLDKPEPGAASFAHQPELVFLSPNEEPRRFPLFTAGQKTLVAIGIGLLLLMLGIAWLLWRQQQRDQQSQAAVAISVAQTTAPVVSPSPSSSPTPTPQVDDAAISEAVKTALQAYSPLGYARYNFAVKDGTVTVNGEAEHQPEKDGVENVVRLVVGVKSVVNKLKLKPEALLPWQLPDHPPVQVNPAEAKVLDEAMRRQVQLAEQATGREPVLLREGPRETREQKSARQREEDAAGKKAAEEHLRREAEETERRQEEQRRAEAAARARAEQARVDPGALRQGTVAWSGLVDGVEEIIIGGASASVRHIAGAPARDVKTSFSAPIPRAPVNVKLISVNGRSPISITQEPSAANGYTTIVRIDDSGKGGDKLHQFTLRWSAQ
jgi:osmotically-inducible protein OsmY